VRLAVDDAGAGFSSFRHIVRTQPDLIKLDVSLIRHIHVDPVRRALASSLAIFAQQIGAQLIAEGIETKEELAAVGKLGINLGQGFYLARPAAIDEVISLCSQARDKV
jgi:EAL domain-containing protein (putative c-di-GMP-specific phosphodiesterase class I)